MNILGKAYTAYHLIGLRGIWHALRYAWQRDRIARRFPPPLATATWSSPGPLVAMETTDCGACWRFINSTLTITFLAPDLVCYEWDGNAPPPPYALARSEWPPVSVQLESLPAGWRLYSEALTVLVSADGSLAFLDAAGEHLHEQLPPSRHNDGWQQRVRLRPEERIYGLGERAAPLNRRGHSYRMWNHDPGGAYQPGDDPLYLCLPLYLGMHHGGSYLVFYENPFDGTFDLGVSDPAIADLRFGGGNLRAYFIAGSPRQSLARYTELTGRAPLPPRWALGYHQSRWGYRTAAEVRAVLAGFQQHDLPLAALALDLDYMDGCRVFTVDQTRFGDLAELASDLARANVHLVTLIDAGVKQDAADALYREGLAGNHFCTLPDGKLAVAPVWPGPSVFPDFGKPATRQWWGQQYTKLLDMGVAGFWHDMNEPAVFAAWGGNSLPLATRHNLDGKAADHRTTHNIYGLLQMQAADTALRALRPQQRPCLFSRSGWAGLQRYAWTWTGDTVSSWESLRQTIPTVLGLGLSGIPFVGVDIGGFNGAPSPELFVRWLQMAAFLPYFRNHAALHTPRREPWHFGEPYLTIARDFLHLRQRLLPYLYTLCWQTTQSGAPLVRPLFWLDERNAALWDVDDAFMLGDDLLVAPILEPGATMRSITLPPGEWFNFWDETAVTGPATIQCAVILNQIPLFVRAGALLPLAVGDNLVLHLYALPNGKWDGQVYSDAGDGAGPGRLDRFTVQRVETGLQVDWQTDGEFPFPYSSVEVCPHGITPRQATLDGEVVEVSVSGAILRVGPFVQMLLEE